MEPFRPPAAQLAGDNSLRDRRIVPLSRGGLARASDVKPERHASALERQGGIQAGVPSSRGYPGLPP